MELLSMVDYVSEIGNMKDYPGHEKALALIYNYSTFLKQPLKLEMFVPCDDEGNILSEPYFDGENDHYYSVKKDEYEKAKSKVLFEGFEIKKSPYDNGQTLYIGWEPYNASIFLNLKGAGWKTDEYKTIEDLLKSEQEIKLTEHAIKIIYEATETPSV